MSNFWVLNRAKSFYKARIKARFLLWPTLLHANAVASNVVGETFVVGTLAGALVGTLAPAIQVASVRLVKSVKEKGIPLSNAGISLMRAMAPRKRMQLLPPTHVAWTQIDTPTRVPLFTL
jgi:hypothetical protein